MSLIKRIEEELKEAMRERDNDRRDALRLRLVGERGRAADARDPSEDGMRCGGAGRRQTR